MVVSKRFELREEDIKKVGRNALIFLAPLFVIYLTSVVAEIQKDGFSWVDFKPSDEVIGAMFLYVLNVWLDLFRKWSGETKYVK